MSELRCKTVRRSSGFSLIEMLTVIAVVGALSAVAIPSFSYMIASTRVKGAATNLQMSMLKSRSEAAKRNASVRIVANTGGWVAGWRVLDAANNVLESQGALRGVTVTTTPSTLTTITYLRSGRISGAAPSLLIRDPEVDSVIRCVSAELSGRPYVKANSC